MKANPAGLLEGLRILAHHVELEIQKPTPAQIIINKCWNVVREVGENSHFIPELIDSIEVIVLPLIKYVDGIRNFDF